MHWVIPMGPPGQGKWCGFQGYEPSVSLWHSPGTADHVSHLENVSEEEINRLLGMVVDVENLFMSVHKEEDTDTKQVYFYLFKVCLGLCMSQFPTHRGTCAISGQCRGVGAGVPLFVLCWIWH